MREKFFKLSSNKKRQENCALKRLADMLVVSRMNKKILESVVDRRYQTRKRSVLTFRSAYKDRKGLTVRANEKERITP